MCSMVFYSFYSLRLKEIKRRGVILHDCASSGHSIGLRARKRPVLFAAEKVFSITIECAQLALSSVLANTSLSANALGF